jgi:cell division transport system permease protein
VLTRLGYFARETMVSLRRNLLMTLAGIITVAVSLCVLGGALLLSRLVDHGTQQWKNGVELEIFMNVNATQNQIDSLGRALSHDKDVRSTRYLTKEDAYREFKRLFADQPDLVQTTDPAALPSSYRVAPAKAELTQTVADRYQSQPGVDEVKTASKEVKKLLSATNWIRTAFIVIFFLLLAASLFLIVNTIRLATFARRREIEVMKLVGASNWFVRIPFMLEGLVQGVIGAAFAFGAVWGLKEVVGNAIARNSDFSRGFYVGNTDAYTIGMYVLILGAAIGVIGSIVGLRRFLEV